MSSPLDARIRELVAAASMRTAATELIRELGPGVRAYLRALLRSDAHAADAFSAFEEHLWRGLPAFRWSAPVRIWAFRIATHAAIDVSREGRVWRGRRLGGWAGSAPGATIEEASLAERRLQRLEAIRRALSPEERSLLSLRVEHGLPWAEIARALSADGHTVKVPALMKRFERLKRRLARELRRYE